MFEHTHIHTQKPTTTSLAINKSIMINAVSVYSDISHVEMPTSVMHSSFSYINVLVCYKKKWSVFYFYFIDLKWTTNALNHKQLFKILGRSE